MSSPANTLSVRPFGMSPRGALGPGSLVHHYELIREVHGASPGPSFLARDTRRGRRVVLQGLPPREAVVLRRVLHETRACAQGIHENIALLHEIAECDQGLFLVWEYLQGQSLKEFIGDQRVAAVRAVELMLPVLSALAHAHERGIVHGDLRPENLLVTGSGFIKVLGFGLAPLCEDPDPSALPYLSPERWSRQSPIDPHADLWAVGLMLFQLLAGRPPLGSLTGPQLAVIARRDEPLPRLRALAPDVPPELAAVIDRCLSKSREDRFPNALALAGALEPFRPGRVRPPEPTPEESPYPGPSPFQEADADRFFGRAREISTLVHRLRQRPLLAVVGPVGVGKTSLLRAGLVPALKRSGTDWEALFLRPGPRPMMALATLVASLLSPPTAVEWDLPTRRALERRLRTEPGYVAQVLCTRARRDKRSILLVVDPLEELYTQVTDLHERHAFTACLLAIADDAASPLRVVLSVRSDVLERVSEDEPFMAELGQGLCFLTAPEREGLREALVQPAHRAGYQFESTALVVHMLHHLESTPGALPLLQFAAARLWEARDPRRKLLTVSAYQAMGGLAGVLTRHANRVLAELSAQERTLVRTLLLRLVTPERTRAIVRASELRALTRTSVEMQRRIDHLVRSHLLVVRMNGGALEATVELVHESLVHGWPTLRQWLDEDQEDALFLEQLRAATRQWQGKARDTALLWHGERVDEARRFQQRFGGELPGPQQEFLAAVFARAQQATRQKRALLAASVTCLGMLLAGAATLGVLQGARREAEARAEKAVASVAVARMAEATAHAAADTARQQLAERQAQQLRQQQQTREGTPAEVELAHAALLDVNERLLAALLRDEEARRPTHPRTPRAGKGEHAAREGGKQGGPSPDGPMTSLRTTQQDEP